MPHRLPAPVFAGHITITEPYPIPLMNQSGPPETEVIIRGTDLRPNVTVVARSDDKTYQQLKTAYISSDESRISLPQAVWRIHRPSFRFVIRTPDSERAVEIAGPGL